MWHSATASFTCGVIGAPRVFFQDPLIRLIASSQASLDWCVWPIGPQGLRRPRVGGKAVDEHAVDVQRLQVPLLARRVAGRC